MPNSDWEEEAHRYAQNADYWREKYETERENLARAVELLEQCSRGYTQPLVQKIDVFLAQQGEKK